MCWGTDRIYSIPIHIVYTSASINSNIWNFQAYYHNIDVKQVDVPSGTGTFGILPNHVPTLAVLRPGVLTVFEDEGAKKFFGKIKST